jgi:hypothetical protein
MGLFQKPVGVQTSFAREQGFEKAVESPFFLINPKLLFQNFSFGTASDYIRFKWRI